ncbi:MAG: hypothetical protein JNM31_01495 [Flavobacteriales bacterium]|nr:hypothetical protein [Flavobacteriales bacterium]
MNNAIPVLVAALALGLGACKKEKATAPDPSPATSATMRVAFNLKNGTAPYTLTTLLTDSAGHKVRFDKVRFYLSAIHLEDDNHVTVAEYHEKVFLVDAANSSNTFTLGTMAPGHVHMTEMHLGLDSATNHQDPMLATAPLNDATMHWGWNPAAGYKFVVLEGRVDSNVDGLVDSTDQLVEYHLATDALFMMAEAHTHADVEAGNTYTLQVTVDIGAVAGARDLLAKPMCHSMGMDMPFAMSLMQAMVLAIHD